MVKPAGHFTTKALTTFLVILPATVFEQVKDFLITTPVLTTVNAAVFVGVGVGAASAAADALASAIKLSAEALASAYNLSAAAFTDA